MKIVTRLFLDGNLKGLTYTEKTELNYTEGQIIESWNNGDRYQIIKVEG